MYMSCRFRAPYLFLVTYFHNTAIPLSARQRSSLHRPPSSTTSTYDGHLVPSRLLALPVSPPSPSLHPTQKASYSTSAPLLYSPLSSTHFVWSPRRPLSSLCTCIYRISIQHEALTSLKLASSEMLSRREHSFLRSQCDPRRAN